LPSAFYFVESWVGSERRNRNKLNIFFSYLFAFMSGLTGGQCLNQVWATGRLETSLIYPLVLSLGVVIVPEILFFRDRKQVKAIQKFIQSLNERA